MLTLYLQNYWRHLNGANDTNGQLFISANGAIQMASSLAPMSVIQRAQLAPMTLTHKDVGANINKTC